MNKQPYPMPIADHCLRNTHCWGAIKVFFLTIYFCFFFLFRQENIFGFYSDGFSIFILKNIISICICRKWWWPLFVNTPWGVCLESESIVFRSEKIDVIGIVIGLNWINSIDFVIYFQILFPIHQASFPSVGSNYGVSTRWGRRFGIMFSNVNLASCTMRGSVMRSSWLQNNVVSSRSWGGLFAVVWGKTFILNLISL